MDRNNEYSSERWSPSPRRVVLHGEISRVRCVALVSRLLLFLLQVVANNIIPDHHPDVFNPPKENVLQPTMWDTIVERLLGGFRRWDAVYFLFIAKHGYPYENTLAFFPLYPVTVNLTAGFVHYVPIPLTFDHWLLICGSLLNLLFFVKAAEHLFEWIQLVNDGQYRSMAYPAAVAFAFNPASIFFSACYSESLFCCLTFKAFVLFEKSPSWPKNRFFGVLLVALSGATRSNGLVSLGVFGLKQLDDLWTITKNQRANQSIKPRVAELVYVRSPLARRPIEQVPQIITAGRVGASSHWARVKLLLLTVFCALLAVIPFLAFQLYSHHLFCRTYSGEPLSKYLAHYARERAYVYLRSSRAASFWCDHLIPLAYSNVQKSHWNVGFFEYYEPKQIPNFLLAIPMVLLCLLSLSEVFFRIDAKSRRKLAPYGVHLLVLLVFCVFFVHIQVTTRMICSSTPLIYLAVGQLFPDLRMAVDWQSARRLLLHGLKTRSQKLIFCYFLGYFVIGTILHCNFLPWT